MNRNRALRFVWLSLLTLVSGLASASTVAFNPNVETRSGTTTKKEAIVLSIDSDDSQSAGNVSISATKSHAGSKTIADLYATKVDEDNVLIYLNNARVVYAEGNNYILREEGRALDVLNTSLVLQQGQYVTGLVRLNVSCSAGIISTSDVVGETNSSQLEITGEVAEEPIPVFCSALDDVIDHPGDLVSLKRLEWFGYFCPAEGPISTCFFLSNARDFNLTYWSVYDVILWHNCYSPDGYPAGKAIKVEPHLSYLNPPTVTGEEHFLESTTVTMSIKESVATIRYTLDGTDPTNTTSQIYTYTQPFVLTETATICAVAIYKDLKSDLVQKRFRKVSASDPLTVAELSLFQKSIENATIKFVNAQVVYAEDNNFIVREENGKAIDLLNTSLPLEQGKTLSGLVKLNVDCTNGLLSTSDIEGSTNANQLTIDGAVSADPLPYTCDGYEAFGRPGDLLRLEHVRTRSYPEFCIDAPYGYNPGSIFISNYEEMGMVASKEYNVTFWYYGTKYGDPLVRVLEAERTLSYMRPPTITGESQFRDPQEVTIEDSENGDLVTIYYTLDGSDPKYSATARLYDGPITLTTTTTVKACAAYKDLWSEVVTKEFICISADAPKTIAQLHSLRRDLAAASIRFVDALVVYKEDLEGTYHYIVREDDMAIDLLNTTLNLDLGATISGNIVMDVAYEDGFLTATDMEKTDGGALTMTGSSANFLPINNPDVLLDNYKGDLIRLDRMGLYHDEDGSWGLGDVYFLTTEDNEISYGAISNYEEFASQFADPSGRYNLMVWYNESKDYCPIVRVVAVQTPIAPPVIHETGHSVDCTTVSIFAAEDASIYYTTDGSMPIPDVGSTQLYTVPISIYQTATVRAVAVKDGYVSDVAEKIISRPMTIAEIHTLGASLQNVMVRLNDALVVYADGNNYVLRENGQALDILNTSLQLKQGQYVKGYVKLGITGRYGVYSTSDIAGETNQDMLTISGEESEKPIPMSCATLDEVNYYPGDLITVENLDWDEGGQYFYSNVDGYLNALYLSNASDFYLESGKKYDVVAWYNQSNYGFPVVKVLSVEVASSVLDVPTVLGKEIFLETTTVTITHPEINAEVKYTLDGTDPLNTTSEVYTYTEPFTLTESATVCAVATYEETTSALATKTFTKVSLADPLTVQELAKLKVSIDNATVKLVNARVVYGDHAGGKQSYILREYINDKFYALDVMDTALPLTVGALVSGTVKLQIDFKENLAHDNGVLVATDIAETNDENLYVEESANKSPRPIPLDPNSFSNVYDYPGDILDVSGVNGRHVDTYRLLWRDDTEVALSNGEEYAISDGVVYDNLLIWYNDVFEDKKGARAKIGGQKERLDYVLTSAGWGTIIIPFYCEKIGDFTIYECTHVNESGVLVMEERDCFKANTPYLLKGTKGVEMMCLFDGYAPYHKDSYTNGVMTGVYSEQEPPADSYILQNHPDMAGLAFYHVTAGKGVTVSANRCYINPQSGGFKSILFPDDETNGVINVNALDSTLVDVYTTAGVKVKHQVEMGKALNDLPAGLYIINNKKIVKK